LPRVKTQIYYRSRSECKQRHSKEAIALSLLHSAWSRIDWPAECIINKGAHNFHLEFLCPPVNKKAISGRGISTVVLLSFLAEGKELAFRET